MSNTRLTVVVRKDLGMTDGLLAAQVAHMSDAFMRYKILGGEKFKAHEKEWMADPYLSVLAVNSYEDLVEIHNHVKREKLPCHKWEDTIPSPTFGFDKPIKAFVGLSIGPADFDAIKIVTGGLDLY